MIDRAKNLTGSLFLALAIFAQAGNAQTPHKKAVIAVNHGPAKENYIATEITKAGAGDHGLFYDTVASKIKLTDLTNSAGRQYQDIKVTLGAGDVIKVNLNGETSLSLSLLNTTNGHLSMVKTIIDTSSIYNFRLSYKAGAAGLYTLRVTSKKRVAKDKYERQYYYDNSASYRVSCIIATPESARTTDNLAICDQLQFLLRQRLTGYMQITGAIADTTMDVLDKKKIGFINHLSTFTFYKNSTAKIAIDPASAYIAFDQSLLYNSDADAAQAQRYFIENFKNCLGPDWTGGADARDTNWYKFERNGYQNISIILYTGYKYVQILM